MMRFESHKNPSDEELTKRERMDEIFLNGPPDVVVVLSGGIVSHPLDRGECGYKTSSYAELDARELVSGGKARVIAAAEISNYYPATQIIATSREKDREEKPTHAEVISHELQRYKVPKERIILETNSTNTLTELEELLKLTQVHGWKRVTIVTSDYHIPRTDEMLRQVRSGTLGSLPSELRHALDDDNVDVRIVAAESILPIRSPHYAELIRIVHATEAYRERVRKEEEGLRDLRAGTYDQ